MTKTVEPPKPKAKAKAKPKAEKSPEKATAELRANYPYRFELVAAGELIIDESYQRPLTSFWVEVRDNFDPALVGCLIVSERKNGKKMVIDGQTRLKAMTERAIEAAPCLIYTDLSQAQEAELFAALQRQRRAMRTYHRFRAEIVAGKPESVDIARIVTGIGYELGTEETPNTLQSITALEKTYAVAPEHLSETMETIRDTWAVWSPDGKSFTIDKDAVSAQIINGISAFIRNQEKLDMERLIDRLRDVTPRLLMNRAAQIREGAGTGTGAAGAIANAILNEYMRRKR